ncbi:MAG: hypothetical protein V4850_18115 [Myxococcota bacterium]
MIRPVVPALLASALVACSGPTPGGGPPLPDTGEDAVCAAWTFDVTPTHWALPAGASSGAFTRAERDVADCVDGLPATRLVDLTGDNRLDFVQLSDCDDPSVGAATWRVWPAVGAAEGAGFGEEVAWQLPGADPGAFAAFRDDAVCTDGVTLPAFRLEHLDDDGRLDLVVIEGCEDDALAGAWRGYPNTGAGFGAAQLREIPTPYAPGSFGAPRETEQCGDFGNAPAWGVVDLDGDGPVDIVLTDTCDTPDVGSTYWAHLANDGATFAPGARWGVPPELRANRLGRALGCGLGNADYFLLDVEGDDRPDLVVPRRCGAEGSDWTVYTNEGTGFASVGAVRRAPWSLNLLVNQREHPAPECDLALPAWVMDDADGDGDADVTVTASCVDPAVGDARWDLHALTREGWSAAAPVALPTGYSTGSFAGGTGDTPGCAGTANRPAWVRRDLDGDGAPELVVTEACADPSVGVDGWLVYRMTCIEG